MDLGHHRDGRDIPRRCSLFIPGNGLLCMAALAYGFISLHSGVVWRQVGDIHRPATACLGTGEMLMLQRLQKSFVHLTFLLRFHESSLSTSLFVISRRLSGIVSTARVQRGPSEAARCASKETSHSVSSHTPRSTNLDICAVHIASFAAE